MPLLWPLYLVWCVLVFYGLWSQRIGRDDGDDDATRPRQEQEARLDSMAAKDAAITDKRCPFCCKPCPDYRKTCKHCGKPVRSDAA